MSAPSIAAVVVTYNRKAMLVECLRSVFNQSQSLDRIFIIDNASTDGTRALLESEGFLSDLRCVYIRLEVNEGGAGGFSRGLNHGVVAGYDWLWVMDDDCVPQPEALAELCLPLSTLGVEAGFVCSHVIWTDGAPHRMNVPGMRLFTSGTAFSHYIDKNVLVVPSCSFVSVLVSAKAVTLCGLPLRQMFLWGDDLEFFRRIVRTGFLGFFAWKSVVLHSTEKNANDDFISSSKADLFKHFYGIRNNLYITRRYKGFFSYFISLFEHLFVTNLKIAFFRKDNKFQACYINTKASLASIFFAPIVDFPKGDV